MDYLDYLKKAQESQALAALLLDDSEERGPADLRRSYEDNMREAYFYVLSAIAFELRRIADALCDAKQGE
jgi:hypothetical protein